MSQHRVRCALSPPGGLELLPAAPQGPRRHLRGAWRPARLHLCGGVPGGAAQPVEVVRDTGGGRVGIVHRSKVLHLFKMPLFLLWSTLASCIAPGVGSWESSKALATHIVLFTFAGRHQEADAAGAARLLQHHAGAAAGRPGRLRRHVRGGGLHGGACGACVLVCGKVGHSCFERLRGLIREGSLPDRAYVLMGGYGCDFAIVHVGKEKVSCATLTSISWRRPPW